MARPDEPCARAAWPGRARSQAAPVLLARARRLLLGLGLALGLLLVAPHAFALDAAAWRRDYARARTLLETGHPAQAAAAFERLAAEAPSPEDGALARELSTVARESARRAQPGGSAHIRTSDELSVLYTAAFIYGIGSGAWVVLLTQPGNIGAAVLPFAGLTAASVGGVAAVDGYKPFRRGVPHSIAAGLFLGLGEGIWAVGLQHAGASRRQDDSRWSAEAVATALWAGATVGGVAGGLVGALREPTPGRVSLTTSAGIWGGLVAGFAGAALEPRARSRDETAFVAGAVGYNVGILGGIAFAPLIAPSVARVRFVDLGAIGGGLLGGGVYALAAERHATVRGGLGSAALGAAAGLGVTWFLTDGMPKDPPEGTTLQSLHAFAVPATGGAVVGVSGEL